MRKLLIIIFLLMGFSGLYTWEKTFGGSGKDVGHEVLQTSDNGYIIIGTTTSYGSGDEDVYLIKTDSRGNLLWTRTYGGSENDKGSSVRQTSDEGYIIVGETWSYGGRVYLIKTDSAGDTLWTKTYCEIEENASCKGSSVQQTSDNGYIITGTILKGTGLGSSYVHLIKTDSTGNTLWTKTYERRDSHHKDEGFWVEQTVDRGYIITGGGRSYDGWYDVLLIKTDSIGDTLWTKTYSESDLEDVGSSVSQTLDHGYIVVGWTAYDIENADVYLIKTDPLGDTLWTKTFGGSKSDWGSCVQQTSDKGYIIVGYTSSYGAGDYDVYLIKTDSLGNSEGIEEKSLNEKRFFSLSVIPNPARREVVIRFGGKNGEEARLSLYDISGRKMMELWRGRLDKNHSFKFNKGMLPSGIYFLQLETHKYIERRKIIIE